MKTARSWGVLFAGVSLLGLLVRLYAATRVGFGDSEALYASYALHPAPAYLDHPGVISLFARLLSPGGPAAGAPSPVTVHRVTAVLATAAPWEITWAARALGAELRFALIAGLVTAVVPEVAVGMFAMTPDLLLFPLWTAALGLAGAGLLAPPSSVRAASCFVLAGLAAGVGVADKASAVGLVLALLLTFVTPAARSHARTIWPWAGLTLTGFVFSPIAEFEAKHGWPMIHHRLVATQSEAGVSLRNLGALLGGQLAYLSPVLAIAAGYVAREIWIRRKDDVVGTLLMNALVVPLALLVPLCIWSKVAEPHWVAPALLALPLAYARRGAALVLPRGLGSVGVALAGALTLTIHAWVLFPEIAAGLMPASVYDARVDISNELYGWPPVIDTVRNVAARYVASAREPGELVVVGPHWIVCAQLEAALGPKLPVGCASRERDAADFQEWYPPERWRGAGLLLFVRDARFPDDAPLRFPGRVRLSRESLDLRRAGRIVRSFTIDVLADRGLGSRD
jgi:Dolichyl-phosphate-mannose-protein mannosyltransferase